MAGLQTIIDNCNAININRRNVVGVQYARNEIPRVSQTPTTNAWKITLDMPNSFRYNEARALLEELDTLDTTTPQLVTFGNNINLRWIWAYQGSASTTQIAALRVSSYIGNQLILTNLPAIAANRYLFKKNDLIQIAGHPYPFTTEEDVLRGNGSTVTITTSRPNIISANVTNLGLVVGTNCQFNFFCPNMPVYKLVVGGYQKTQGVVQNNALIEWSDSFYMYEFTGDA
jgi:hypothetical protein